ncbi:MAG: alpha-ketoglutarate-dependent dioxygenase AlkB [Proteobacteria bacterium]|nr:alpha-ketoglutarate-dependent dioxygenase AlkB [Pseudomonadota bacterium]
MAVVSLAPGVTLWREKLSRAEQLDLLAQIQERLRDAPFYKPLMPKSGTPFSVEETNFGSLGWFSDRAGYRYVAEHPLTQKPWPAIPGALLALWDETTAYGAPPECCLVNRYGSAAKMGLHQDRDEQALDAPVLSVSLGDDAVFRFGGATRKGPTQSVVLSSGDVLTFGGPARRMFHGIDRIRAGSSTLLPGGGRINLTLRRVNPK